jgi:hypothetical protein
LIVCFHMQVPKQGCLVDVIDRHEKHKSSLSSKFSLQIPRPRENPLFGLLSNIRYDGCSDGLGDRFLDLDADPICTSASISNG